jgi:citrate lyase gamma subunit
VALWNFWRKNAAALTPLYALKAGARVRVGGVVEALELLTDPTSGRLAVAIDYVAKVPGALDQIYPGLLGDPAQSVHRLQKTVPFLLRDTDASVRIHPPSSEGDLTALHGRLKEQFGISLRAEATLIEVAQRIEVEGVVERVESHDPRRGVPWLATIEASGLFLA